MKKTYENPRHEANIVRYRKAKARPITITKTLSISKEGEPTVKKVTLISKPRKASKQYSIMMGRKRKRITIGSYVRKEAKKRHSRKRSRKKLRRDKKERSVTRRYHKKQRSVIKKRAEARAVKTIKAYARQKSKKRRLIKKTLTVLSKDKRDLAKRKAILDRRASRYKKFKAGQRKSTRAAKMAASNQLWKNRQANIKARKLKYARKKRKALYPGRKKRVRSKKPKDISQYSPFLGGW